MPAGVLVVLLLGAISFDLSLVYLRQRQASSVAVGIANDLASAAFDEGELRSSGRFVLDPNRAEALGVELADLSDLRDEIITIDVDVLADDSVRVTLTVAVEYVFARAIPGAADGTTVRAGATAVAASTD